MSMQSINTHQPNVLEIIPSEIHRICIESGCNDPLVGKIVAGTGMIFLGYYLSQKKTDNQRLKLSFQVFAAITMAYGVYCLAMAILELSHSDFVSDYYQQGTYHKDLFSERCLRSGSNCTMQQKWLVKSNQTSMQEAIQEFKKCPEANALWKEVNTGRPVCTIIFPLGRENKTMIDIPKKIIVINMDLERDQKLLYLFSGSARLKHHDFNYIQKSYDTGNYGSEAYFEDMNSIDAEIETDMLHIGESCVKNKFWDYKEGFFGLGGIDFFMSLRKASRQQAKLQWETQFKDIFCYKNPSDEECIPEVDQS